MKGEKYESTIYQIYISEILLFNYFFFIIWIPPTPLIYYVKCKSNQFIAGFWGWEGGRGSGDRWKLFECQFNVFSCYSTTGTISSSSSPWSSITMMSTSSHPNPPIPCYLKSNQSWSKLAPHSDLSESLSLQLMGKKIHRGEQYFTEEK